MEKINDNFKILSSPWTQVKPNSFPSENKLMVILSQSSNLYGLMVRYSIHILPRVLWKGYLEGRSKPFAKKQESKEQMPGWLKLLSSLSVDSRIDYLKNSRIALDVRDYNGHQLVLFMSTQQSVALIIACQVWYLKLIFIDQIKYISPDILL